jgi:hypothetical protein
LMDTTFSRRDGSGAVFTEREYCKRLKCSSTLQDKEADEN